MSVISFNSELSSSSMNIDHNEYRPSVPIRKKRIRSLLVNCFLFISFFFFLSTQKNAKMQNLILLAVFVVVVCI